MVLIVSFYFKDATKVGELQDEASDSDNGFYAEIIIRIKSFLKTLYEGFATVLKKRPYNERFCLIMMISAFLLEMFTNYQWVNFFLYYQLRLKFTMEDFALLMAIGGFVGLSGQFIFVPLFCNVLKFHDATIALLGKYCYQSALSKIVSNM